MGGGGLGVSQRTTNIYQLITSIQFQQQQVNAGVVMMGQKHGMLTLRGLLTWNAVDRLFCPWSESVSEIQIDSAWTPT